MLNVGVNLDTLNSSETVVIGNFWQNSCRQSLKGQYKLEKYYLMLQPYSAASKHASSISINHS